MESEIEKLRRLMGIGGQYTKNVTNINETKKIKYLIEALSGGGKGDIMYYIAKGLGFSDEVSQSLGKNVDDFSEQSKQITAALEKAGIDDIGKLQSKLKSAGGINRTSDLTEKEIEVALTEYFKQYPEQAKQILMSTTDFTDKLVSNMSIKDIFSKYPEIIEGLEYVVSPAFKLDETNSDILKNNLINVLDGLNKLPQTGNIKEVTYLLQSKFDAANLIDNFKGANKNTDSGAEGFGKNTEEELIEKLNNNGTVNDRGWYDFGPSFRAEEMSGWKFHIFGETLEDSAFLIEKLKSVADKYNASSKVGGPTQVNLDSMKPGTPQHGKQGVCMYIPQSVINNGQQDAMLKDIESAISGYEKSGTISGDKSITPSIHYRYELNGPIKEGDIKTYNDYTLRYNKNTGGPYKPDDVNDLFSKATNKSTNNTTNTVSGGFLSSKFGDTSKINWTNITNAKNMSDYDVIIDNAMKTGNFNTISRTGFEDYGIPNFRKYLEDIYNKEKGVSNIKPQDNVSDVYKTNRQLYDAYLKEGGDEKPMYDWFNTLPEDQMNDIYKYIDEKKINSVQGDQSNKVNFNNEQPQNQPRSPYERYGAGSN
jgi:hypothetical protein